MTNALVNFRKICFLPLVWLVSLEASLEAESKKGFFRLNHWWFSRKAKCLIVVAIVAVLLISVFAFLPKQSVGRGNVVLHDNSTATPSSTAPPQKNGTSLQEFSQWISSLIGSGSATQTISQPKPPGLIETSPVINSAVWMQVAANAWAYFQPRVGVDAKTGLPYTGGPGFNGFTDSDLGFYIQAIIDAQKLNLTTTGGAWGSNARINMVLTFLENRPLNANNYPYQFYDATTGQNYSSIQANEIVDVVDTGRLFVALNNLINLNSSLQQPIDNFVNNTYGNSSTYGHRSDYAALVPSLEGDASSNSIYAYYFISGFASFWPQQLGYVTNAILNNIVNSDAPLLGDPLLCSVFELNNDSSQLMALSKQVYLASEAYYNATGQYRAFSEGTSPSGQWIYEWVVSPDGNQTWVVLNGSGQNPGISPVIYTKVAMSFLAIYNTTFARNMVVYLERALPDPSQGYYDGVDESGIPLAAGDITNGLILDAATYAIQNNP